MDPRFRLQRRFPGEDLGDPGFVGRRLLERDREPPPPRLLAGSTLKVAATGGTKKARKIADPRPNAPLLIRIVRYPYGLAATRGRRQAAFVAGLVAREGLLERPAILAEARAARGEVVVGNPIRKNPTRVERLAPIPTVAEWLGGPRG